MDHYVEKKSKNLCGIKRKRWTAKEDIELRKAIKDFGFDWLSIAQRFPNRNPNQCSQRWKNMNGKYFQKKRFWTQEEDAQLLQLIKTFGKKWKLIEENIDGRTSKQCRDRYLNKLDPDLKTTEFTVSEDQVIYEKYLILGRQWSKIVDYLPGRSQNQVKNRFYTYIRTHYFKIKNPYYCKQTQEENQNELEQARKIHLLLIQNNQMSPLSFNNDDHLDFQSNQFQSPICFGSDENHNSEMNFEF